MNIFLTYSQFLQAFLSHFFKNRPNPLDDDNCDIYNTPEIRFNESRFNDELRFNDPFAADQVYVYVVA